MSEARNDGLHPRHPGVGKGTFIIEAEGEELEEGGFFAFMNDGSTKVIQWRSVNRIQPTYEAAKTYAIKLAEMLHKSGWTQQQIEAIRWDSVTAAIQRVILDWNDKLAAGIGARYAREFKTNWLN